MKKISYLFLAVYLMLFTAQFGFAVTAQQVLQQRLAKLNTLSASFQQVVKDPNGRIVEQGRGTFQLKRPNLFRLNSQTPQENIIVSDGKTLWFYDPFVEQVTANWLIDVVHNTPFTLLTSNNKEIWQQYQVKQKENTFSLIPKENQSRIKQFNLQITASGNLISFSTVEQDGQTNTYLLHNQSDQALPNSVFQFKVPQGVEFDDQRK